MAYRFKLIETVVSVPRADVCSESQDLVVAARSDDDLAIGDDVREKTDEGPQPRPSL